MNGIAGSTLRQSFFVHIFLPRPKNGKIEEMRPRGFDDFQRKTIWNEMKTRSPCKNVRRVYHPHRCPNLCEASRSVQADKQENNSWWLQSATKQIYKKWRCRSKVGPPDVTLRIVQGITNEILKLMNHFRAFCMLKEEIWSAISYVGKTDFRTKSISR